MSLKNKFQNKLVPFWAIMLLFQFIFTYYTDTCNGTLHFYLITCSILLGLWFLVYNLAKLKYKHEKLPHSYFICLFSILVVYAIVSVAMTYKVSDPSLKDCYKTDEENSSSTTTIEMKKSYSSGSSYSYSSSNYSIGKMTFGSVVLIIYINNLIPFLGLGYGLFKFLISICYYDNEEYRRL